MATLAQPQSSSSDKPPYSAAEQTLADLFDEIIEPLTAEQRAEFYAELRANAIAHGE